MPDTKLVTIARHIIEEERKHPETRGVFSNILTDMALAAKVISHQVNIAGLVDILGGTGRQNVQGEAVEKLDIFAQEVICRAMDHTGNLCCMVSEEKEDVIPIPEKFPTGDYILVFDPLDGSSNIDVNASIGTIFAIYSQVSGEKRGSLEDCLQPGRNQLAAGYVLYGSSTMMVYTSGSGVHGFTLDPSIGEFILSHPNIRIPERSAHTYSINESYYARWAPGQRKLIDDLKAEGTLSSRYIGSLVADFHRNLLKGGIFLYPGDRRSPEGKLRLLYEANPLAFIVEQAGGAASNGWQRILDIEPEALHQRCPLIIGSEEDVRLAEAFYQGKRD